MPCSVAWLGALTVIGSLGMPGKVTLYSPLPVSVIMFRKAVESNFASDAIGAIRLRSLTTPS